MKKVYPVILTPSDNLNGGYSVHVPDLDIDTQGLDLADAIYMARDVICMVICYKQDQGITEFPDGNPDIKAEPHQKLTYVDVDVDAYRRAHDNRAVRRNCSLPSWLNEKADEAGINVSKVLQEALEERLGINA
jgi:predicted RNase H-like HicB family nuclease